jgi:hypothetical protein
LVSSGFIGLNEKKISFFKNKIGMLKLIGFKYEASL